MSPEQFAYWMQGFVELTNGAQPTKEQWKAMTEHLKTVFHKVTPPLQIQPQITNPLVHPNPLSPYQTIPGINPPISIC